MGQIPATTGLPPSVDEHPLVLEHMQRKREIAEALRGWGQEHERLSEELSVLHAQRTKALAACGPSLGADIAARRTALENALAMAHAQVVELERAAQHVDGSTRALRAQVSAELTQQATAAVQRLMRDMLVHVDEIERLSIAMETLRQHRSVSLPLVPVVLRDLAGKFRTEARRFGVHV